MNLMGFDFTCPFGWCWLGRLFPFSRFSVRGEDQEEAGKQDGDANAIYIRILRSAPCTRKITLLAQDHAVSLDGDKFS